MKKKNKKPILNMYERSKLVAYRIIAIMYFLISALLYFGAVPIRKLKIKSILLLYGLIVVLGSVFTFVKYKLVRSPGLTFMELFDKLIIVYAVSGIIMVFFVLFSFLGKRKMEKELE